MESSVYLSDEFLDHLINKAEELSVKKSDLDIPPKKLNYQKIKNILTKSNLYLDYTKEEFVEAIKNNENPIKVAWLNRLIKGDLNKNFNQKIDYSKSSAIFLDADVDCTKISSGNNVLCKGTNYNFEEGFFNDPLRTVFDWKMNTKDISNSFHYCKNIILIDPYIFANQFKKEKSLINFLSSCFNFKNRITEKHLTIITEFPAKSNDKDCVKNKIINKYLKSLSDELNIKIENISLLRHVGTEFQSNRHLITDYALMDLQHVFDRDSVVTGLYFYNNDVGRNFSQVADLINKIKDLNLNTEEHPKTADDNVNLNKLKFGNILNNPLLT